MPKKSPTPPAPGSVSAQPAPPSLLEDMGMIITRLFYDFRGLVGRVLVECGLDEHISPGVGPILFALFENDGCTIKEISRRTRLAPCTLTGQLSRMKKAGLVRSRADRRDRRAVRVWLTPLGDSLRAGMDELHSKLMAVVQNGMDDREFERVRDGMVRMVESIREHEREWQARRAAEAKGQ